MSKKIKYQTYMKIGKSEPAPFISPPRGFDLSAIVTVHRSSVDMDAKALLSQGILPT